ncbi:putative protein kinase RLK-Pelle-LRR-I-1 family [Helianthus debilis subsp. tardiflorus]
MCGCSYILLDLTFSFICGPIVLYSLLLDKQNMASTMNQFAHLQIPLEDVAKATNNFHHDNIIEHGGVGIAYKGRLLWSGRLMEIAARRFDCKHGDGDLEFLAEISALSDLKHKNLVSIIGFCDEIDEKIIVTTYGANGSLGQYLNNLNLTWKQRLSICVDVAHALSYLHYDEGRDYAIIHRNITSDTILLDEKGEAKLSSFEISIKQSVNHKDKVYPCEHAGTMGCVDPTIEKTGGVTHKSDIYSFGVVLFEILCGRKALTENEDDRFLPELAKYHYEKGTLHDIIHRHLLNQILSPQSLLIYSKVAYSCLNEDRAHRPDMPRIVAELEKALELQLRHENIVRPFSVIISIFLSFLHSNFPFALYLYFLFYLNVSQNRMLKRIKTRNIQDGLGYVLTWHSDMELSSIYYCLGHVCY